MDALVVLIPVMPLLAACVIGVGIVQGSFCGSKHQALTALVANWAIWMTSLLLMTLCCFDLLNKNQGVFEMCVWLAVDNIKLPISFITSGFQLRLAALFAILLLVVLRFSVNYLHGQPGFHRYFAIMSVFSSAILLLVLSANALGTLIGWELSGMSAYWLIAYAYKQPVTVSNATRVVVANRIGDATFVLGIGLSQLWIGSIDWSAINASINDLNRGEITAIGLCFCVAALAKSAQLPFSPWLGRAMEGPLPSCAAGVVMVHSGIFLIMILEPLISEIPLVQALLMFAGITTALYSYLSGLTSNDVKSSSAFATSSQLGLMFLECGLGFWEFAAWHLCAHTIARCYLILTTPSLISLNQKVSVEPVAPFLSQKNWLYPAARQQFWIEQINSWVLVKPVQSLAHDLSYFDDNVLDKLLSVPLPLIQQISLSEQKQRDNLNLEDNVYSKSAGLIGVLLGWLAAQLNWLETRFIKQSLEKDTLRFGNTIGQLANSFERSVLKPRYLMLLVFVTLLMAF